MLIKQTDRHASKAFESGSNEIFMGNIPFHKEGLLDIGRREQRLSFCCLYL